MDVREERGGEAMLPGDDRSRMFVFEHKLFSVDGGYFAIQKSTGEAAFHVPLGELKGAIPLSTLRYEFRLQENSVDGRLLDVVEKSLRYVKEIRPYDSIPHELLDGRASWSVEERHRQIARNRMSLHLVSWMSGGEASVSDTAKLAQIAEDQQTKQRVQEAFTRMAEKLGLGKDRRQDVVDMIESIARELSYIEALRERFGRVRYVSSQLNVLGNLYRRDTGIRNDIFRMQVLIKPPVTNFDTMFGQVDAQTGEVLSVVKNLQAQIRFIRNTRDELHHRLMLWDDIIVQWDAATVERSAEIEILLKETYRFLARHFSQASEWPLTNR
ncbi:hypothetical protein [Arenibaculum sp.]|uniref:hypothetical protein n=1 Tax=Arenibaculum sp. TaxID=2865862 RepID=UPI002E0F6247|nr:hypothetical protein [Arenibaculum sp.]